MAAAWLLNMGWGGSLEEAPAPEPSLDNTDPVITGGGRVLREGEWPEWWKEWETSQPKEDPPEPKRNVAELLAEAAGALDMPAPKAPEKPAQKPKARKSQTYSYAVEVMPTVEVNYTHTANFDAQGAAEYVIRRQNRRTAALLLLKLLD